VNALHDDYDCAGPFVVEARQQGVCEPLIRCGTLGLRQSVVRLQRIVDNDQLASTPGECAANRRRQPKAPRGEFDFGL
jgi:hypothetical protein